MSIRIDFSDDILRRYQDQIAAIGQGAARPALARALNRVARMAKTRVVRAIVADTSIPRAMAARSVRTVLAAHRGEGDLFAGVTATGRPISLKHFRPTQLSYGVRAKVFGAWQRFPGAFMGPSPGVIAPRLGGHVYTRMSSARLPIERQYGPAVPEALTRSASQRAVEEVVAAHLPKRIQHELGRLLAG